MEGGNSYQSAETLCTTLFSEDGVKKEMINDLDISNYILDACYEYETVKTEPTMFIECGEMKSSEDKPFTLCMVDDDGNVLEQYVERNGVFSPAVDHHVISPSKTGLGKRKSSQKKVKKKLKRKPKSPKIKLNKLKKCTVAHNSYFCNVCKNNFMGRKLFMLHLCQHYTTNDNHYRCCLCQYRSKIQGHIKRHVMGKHCLFGKDKSIFPCTLCDKSFIYKSELEAHTFFHVRNGKHKCSMCNFSHSKKSSLLRHMLRHDEGEEHKLKDYECHHCGYKCEFKAHLIRHIEQHLGHHRFECGQCGYRCIYSSDYKKHCTIHSDERPLVCSTCSMTFKRRAHLKSHLKNENSCLYHIKRKEKDSDN